MSKIDLKKISYLAKIKLSDKKEQEYSNSLESILDWVEQLNEVDTQSIETINSLTDNINFREDKINKINQTDDILKNAPDRDGDFFRVPKVIDE